MLERHLLRPIDKEEIVFDRILISLHIFLLLNNDNTTCEDARKYCLINICVNLNFMMYQPIHVIILSPPQPTHTTSCSFIRSEKPILFMILIKKVISNIFLGNPTSYVLFGRDEADEDPQRWVQYCLFICVCMYPRNISTLIQYQYIYR